MYISGEWSDLVVGDGDACVAEGVLFRRRSGWGVIDDESIMALSEDDPVFSVPVAFEAIDEPAGVLDRRRARILGTWSGDRIVANGPVTRWTPEEDEVGSRAWAARPTTSAVGHDAAEKLVDLMSEGIITEIEHIPHAGAWRHVAYVTDHGYDDEVRALLAPGPVTIAASPWSREAWLGCFAAIERLSHLAGFSDGVHDGIPQHEVWLTRVTAADVALMRAVPREMVRIERLLVKPDSYAR